MRLLTSLIALLFATITCAEEADPRAVVVGYECRHVDPVKDGFKCALEHGELLIHFVIDATKQPPESREYMLYRYHYMLLRFFDFGGSHAQISADFWPRENKKLCSRVKDKRFIYVCQSAP